MATLGQQLKAAREAKGVSESEAGQATKTLTKLIVEMEADDFSEMAAPMYAKGFIRIYANYLGLDPQPLVEEYLQKHAPGARKPLIDENSQLEQSRKKSPSFNLSFKSIPQSLHPRTWLAHPARLLSGIRKHLPQKSASPPDGALGDPRKIAIGIAGLMVVLILIFSISNCIRRNRTEPAAPLPPPAAARQLLDEPLPDLYLMEPGQIEQGD
jgi:hypothetical protein